MRTATVLALAAWLAALTLVHAQQLNEAYGDGPPYYGRSTNMDKWTSPWPALLALDAGTLVACGTLYLRARRGKRREPASPSRPHAPPE
jgi:hypothetical protein